MDFKQSATEICDAIVTASGGPLMSKADAVTYVEKFLREMWRQAEEREHGERTMEQLSHDGQL